MAEQELDRAASDTITERAVEALANARLSSQIPEFSGDEPSSTALIRVLMNFVQCALHVLRFGDHVSIEPNPVMHQYMRTMLERTPNSMFYIAFDSTAQSREPWDLSARSNAIDVMQSFELVPDAAIVTRYASQLVDLLCVEGKFQQYEQYSMFKDSDAIGHAKDWLYNVLDVLPRKILAEHAEPIVALVKRGFIKYRYDWQDDLVCIGIYLFGNMPPSIIAEHASTFLDVMEDESQYGDDCCNVDGAMEVLKAIDPTMLGVSCLARLRLMFANPKIDHEWIWGLIEKIEPASIAERVDIVVTYLCVGQNEKRNSKMGDLYPVRKDHRGVCGRDRGSSGDPSRRRRYHRSDCSSRNSVETAAGIAGNPLRRHRSMPFPFRRSRGSVGRAGSSLEAHAGGSPPTQRRARFAPL